MRVQNNKLYTGYKYKNQQVVFGSTPINAAKAYLSNESNFVKLAYWFSKHTGEKDSIILNNGGKAFLAPLAIIFNPFSKEDKDTKEYSAGRQFFAAGLAILAQLGVSIKVDKSFDNLARNGKLGQNLDIREGQAKEVLEIAQKRLKVVKDRFGFVLALITLPITCTLLNWLYPKVVDKIARAKALKHKECEI